MSEYIVWIKNGDGGYDPSFCQELEQVLKAIENACGSEYIITERVEVELKIKP